MHRLLKRQLKRHYSGNLPEALQPLLHAIDQAYQQADVEREMLQRSLQLTSEELLERNQKLELNLHEQAASQ